MQAAAVADQIKPVSEHSFGIHTGVNIGLVQLDAQYDHFYGYASTTLGIPLITNGNDFIGNVGLGYTVALSSPAESMWFFDMYAQGLGGKMALSTNTTPSTYGAVGPAWVFATCTARASRSASSSPCSA